MPFSKGISQEVLIRSKRHCCFCYRFCGKNIELHHIIPKSKGGKDSLENCIPLCFDCHADIGHYNYNHPKGKKVTPEELKYNRNRLYSFIEKGTIPKSNSNKTYDDSLVLANIEMDELNCLWGRLDNTSSDIKLVFHELALFRWPKEKIEQENRTLDPIFDITLLNLAHFPITLNRVGILLFDYWQKFKGIASPQKILVTDFFKINLSPLKDNPRQYLKLPAPILIPSTSPYRFTFQLGNYHNSAPANCVVIMIIFDTSLGQFQSDSILLGSF